MLLLSSCGKVLPELSSETCIRPAEKIAYPIGIPPSPNEKLLKIGPLSDWHFQTSLPESIEGGYAPQLVAWANDIWVLPLDGTKVFRYGIDTDKWKSYNTIDTFTAAPRNIFLAEDGTLWGVGTITKEIESTNNLSFLSRYNENSDQFEFVQDTDGLFDEILAISSPVDISEDENGIFWFFGSLLERYDIGLLSFDPSTRKVEKHLSFPNGFVYTGPVVDIDGVIWFYQGGPEKQLMKYSPTTRQVQPYKGLLNFDELGEILLLYFDRDGRLWLDNRGWLDFRSDSTNPVWYKIIPPPVFLTDRGEGQSKYGWLTPFYISQSSNGWFWFTTLYGTIRLDPKMEEWCKFTTGSSPVVEDDSGNLWIVVFDKLYNYHLEP